MFLTQSAIAANPRLMGHLQTLQANRNIWNNHNAALLEANRSAMTPEMLQANALTGLQRDFWQEVDRQVVQFRNQETGMEIVSDLLAVQTVLDIGKTVKSYNIAGDIANDVSISIDGQAPYSFDHTEYDNDGDPVPIFTAGYGVNWRHNAGLNTVGIDLVLDSQSAKLRKYYKHLVAYTLNGSDRIKVDGKPGQGLKNHRNTAKVNLGSGAGGAAINLVTAGQQDLLNFFTKGAFGQTARANKVDAYDVLWVSSEIFANLDSDYVNGGVVTGTIADRIKARAKVREIRETYALTGNEYIAYQRRQDVVTPLVGMATGVVPLTRLRPQDNHNFQIMGAMGLQIKRDGDGKSGVQYGAELA